MKTNISEREVAQGFLESSLAVRGTFIRTVYRANGDVERKVIPNVVTADGLNNLANRAIADGSSKYNWLAIGTANYTPHINSQEILETGRKVAALISSSKELIVCIATWGGAADSILSSFVVVPALILSIALIAVGVALRRSARRRSLRGR